MTLTQPLKTRVATYLTGTRARQQALTSLAATGWFTVPDEAAVVDALNKFLADNPTNSCADGIERFRRAVDFPEPPTPRVYPAMSAVRSLRLALDIAKALDPSEEGPLYCDPIIVIPASAPDPMPCLPPDTIRDIEQTGPDAVTYVLGHDGATVRIVRVLPDEEAPDPEVDGAPGYHYCPACRHVLVSNLIEASGRRSLDGAVCCSDCSDDMMDAEQAAAEEQEILRQEARAEWRMAGEHP